MRQWEQRLDPVIDLRDVIPAAQNAMPSRGEVRTSAAVLGPPGEESALHPQGHPQPQPQPHSQPHPEHSQRLSSGGVAAWRSLKSSSLPETLPEEPTYDPDNKYESFCTENGTLAWATHPNSNSGECTALGDRKTDYLNRKDVQAALNVNTSVSPAFGEWETCVSDTQWLFESSYANVLTSYYQPILEARPDFRVLVYSGDEDIATVPHTETQQCLSELVDAMALKESKQWGPWTRDGITLGYWEQYTRYSFATIKGAGHLAPTNQPMIAYEALHRWLASSNLSAPLPSALSY